MGDQQECSAALSGGATQQVEHLRLNGDVEGGGRLVGNDHGRLAREGHGDHGALAHATRELVRVLPGALLWLRDLDLLEIADGQLMRLFPAQLAVGNDHLGDLLANRGDRVERRERLLEDHADATATNRAQLIFAEANELSPLELDRAFDDRLLATEQRDDRHRRNGLAGARLTDDRQAFTSSEIKGDAVNNFQDAAAGAEADRKILHREEWCS